MSRNLLRFYPQFLTVACLHLQAGHSYADPPPPASPALPGMPPSQRGDRDAPLLSVGSATVLPVMSSQDAPENAAVPSRVRATLPQMNFRAAAPTAPPDDFYQTYESVGPWLRSVAKLQPGRVSHKLLGKSTEGREIVGLQVTPGSGTPSKWRRLVVLCRQHGNEPEATASGNRLLYQWFTSSNKAHRRIASQTVLLFVSVSNPDGAARYARRTAKNIDMNRDWSRKESVEVKALSRAITNFKPHLVIDVHQWAPHPRMPPSMAEASGGILARQAAQAMAQHNANKGFYLAARSRVGLASLCHRYHGQILKTPAILLESRHRPGVPGARAVAITQTLTALWSAAGVLAGKAPAVSVSQQHPVHD